MNKGNKNNAIGINQIAIANNGIRNILTSGNLTTDKIKEAIRLAEQSGRTISGMLHRISRPPVIAKRLLNLKSVNLN